MAEIRVERKRKSNIWPWILGLLVAALLVWAITEVVDRDDTPAVVDDAAALELNLDTSGAPVTLFAEPVLTAGLARAA